MSDSPAAGEHVADPGAARPRASPNRSMHRLVLVGGDPGDRLLDLGAQLLLVAALVPGAVVELHDQAAGVLAERVDQRGAGPHVAGHHDAPGPRPA